MGGSDMNSSTERAVSPLEAWSLSLNWVVMPQSIKTHKVKARTNVCVPARMKL